uniref:Large ribosomal subunit protein bL9c n=1 Tax=Dichotomaria marginata TaxID=268567 RepID=A0A1G4NSP2_9FLOR|nr:Ribosomal protein L9 [Dichotomaria marginata]SCW21635.1 Ribosomal protein L9 [Dichotomaria marginata]
MANKKINVILNKNFKHLGAKGDIIEVAKGYARNYLFRNEIAVPIHSAKINYLEYLKQKQIKEFNIQQNEAKKIQNYLKSINKFTIKRKISKNNIIFGSITEKDIIETIRNNTGIELNKSQIKLPDLKKTGIHIIDLEIIKNFNVQIKLQILPETI